MSKHTPLTPWHVIERRHLLSRRFLTLREDHVRLANGQEIDDFCVIEAPDWAAVLCITPEHQVVLVRQYRHGCAAESIELPAGSMEAGELPLVAAQRELLEETGYASDTWLPLLEASLDPARTSARAHFYCALDARIVATPRLDPSEDLETLLVSATELLEMIDTGRLLHGIHIAAILMAQRSGLL